jgi:hypothetical protein
VAAEKGGDRKEGQNAKMGEAKLKQKQKNTATQKLIAEFPKCCFCGGARPTATREHMPPISLFDASHRPDDLVMPACNECNKGTSTADLVVALISRWSSVSTPQEQKDHAKLAKRILIQAPSLVRDEWLSIADDPIEKLRARQHLLAHGVNVPADASLAMIGPETVRHLNLFAHKAALALYFHHFRRGLPRNGGVCAYWRTKEDFAQGGVPKMFFDLLPSYGTITQGQWNERETFEYRLPLKAEEGVFGCLARFRRGFFVYGFAVDDVAVLPDEERAEWICPEQILSIPQIHRHKQ